MSNVLQQIESMKAKLLTLTNYTLLPGLSPRGISGLCQSLRSSPKILETLTHLNLSGNWIKGDEAEVHKQAKHTVFITTNKFWIEAGSSKIFTTFQPHLLYLIWS